MSGLRIIAGSARGRRLKAVPGDTTRPITDRTKEALFSILGPDIVGASVLDLFAGTGSVGIEALSRGAAYARFLDMARPAIHTIHENLAATQLAGKAEVLRMDAFEHLRSAPDRVFDYVYIAPPQYKDMWLKTLAILDHNPGWLSEDAWVIVQIHPVEASEFTPTVLEEFDRRVYGSTLLIFYQRAGAAEEEEEREEAS